MRRIIGFLSTPWIFTLTTYTNVLGLEHLSIVTTLLKGFTLDHIIQSMLLLGIVLNLHLNFVWTSTSAYEVKGGACDVQGIVCCSTIVGPGICYCDKSSWLSVKSCYASKSWCSKGTRFVCVDTNIGCMCVFA